MNQTNKSNTLLNVLCLEDVLNDARLIKEILVDAGFLVSMDIAAGENEYHSFLKNGDYDIVLADYALPGFDIYTALKMALELQPEVPFICVSGTISEDTVVELLKQGATDYILKDRLGRLAFAVRRALEGVVKQKKWKKTEEALRESEEKYRVLFEGSTLGILATDVETHRLLYSNPAICRIFGYLDEEFLRLTIPDLHPKDSMDLVISEFESQMRGEKVISSALPCLRKDGTVFYADISGNIIIINGRKCSVGFFVDVTTRKQAEEALKQANSELQNLHNNLDLAVFSVDVIHNKMLQVSIAHEAVFGYSQEAFFNNPMLWYEIIVPEDKLIIDANYPVLFSGKNLHHEYRIVHADGQIRWIEAKMKPTLDMNGKLIRIDGIASNITERKRLEETLQESKVKYQEIFESTGTATFIGDENAIILMANNECYSITGYTPTEIIGQKWNQYFAPESLQEILKNHKLRRKNPDLAPKKHEVKLFNKQGEKRDVILNISMISGTKQSIVSILDITERKRAEEALRKSEENLGKMVANIGDVIVIIDQNGINRYKSPNIEKWFGWRPEEVIGFSAWENIHPDELNSVQKIFGALLGKPNATVTTECRYRCKDGSYKWIEFTGINLLHDPYIQGILGNYHDITERKQAEETLDQERVLLRTIIDNFPNSIFVKDKKYRKIVVNLEHVRRVTAYLCPAIPFSKEDLLGKTDFEVYTRELAEGFLIEDQKVLEGGQSVLNQELLSIDANGRSHWELISKIPLRDRNGEIIGLVGISNDITERKRTEQAILQSEENFHRSISESPLGIRIVSVYGKTIYANKAFLDIFEFTRLEEFTNISAINRYTPESYVQHQERKGKREKGHDVLNYDISIVRKTGEIRNIKVSRKEVLWNGIKHFQVINIDITEQKKLTLDLIAAKEKAEESNSLKTAFLNNISHEIRTPFNGILGFLSLIQDDDLQGSERDKYISIINQSADRLMNTINDIVEISQIQARKMQVTSEETNIKMLTDELLGRFMNDAESHGLEFTFINDLPNNITSISTDSIKLKTILSNLIGNAIKFTKTGSVELNLKTKSDILEFSVKDTGIGISENKQQIIFERFMQSNVTNTREFEGLGLGLSIAKANVEMLGGNIWVESELGKGSTFYFTIPYNAEPEVKSSH